MRNILTVAKQFLFDTASRIPKARLSEIKPDLAAFLAPGEALKFIWFGHSTLLLQLDGQVILIDPVFSGAASPVPWMVKRFQPAALAVAELPPVDTVLISHDHYDHLDKATILAFRDRTTEFIVPTGVGKHLRGWGIPGARITERGWGESHRRNGVTFTAAPARHFSGRGLLDRNKTVWASWVIAGAREKLFYSGDSSYGEHFKEIGNRFGPFDLAFMENGQYNELWRDVHMMPEETVQAAIDVKARVFVPVHWGMFDLAVHHWTDPIVRSFRTATERQVPIIAPRLGEVVDLGRQHSPTQWWTSASAPVTAADRQHRPDVGGYLS